MSPTYGVSFWPILVAAGISTLVVAQVHGDTPVASIALVLDDSSSMEGESMAAALASTSLAIAASDSQLELCLLALNTNVAEEIRPLAADASRRRALLDATKSVKALGGTDLYGRILDAEAALLTSACPNRWIVVLTDGRHTASVPAQLRVTGREQGATDAGVVSRLANRLRGNRIRVLAIGLGDEVSKDLLADLAAGTAGRFVAVPTAHKLLPEFVGWLRMIGGYYVIDSETSNIGSDDRNFKMLASLSEAAIQRIEHDDQPINRNGALSLWSDAQHHLYVAQASQPPEGRYRVVLNRPRGLGDHIYFLKRSTVAWSATFFVPGEGAAEPLRLALQSNRPISDPTEWKATCTIRDARNGGVFVNRSPLAIADDGKFTGTFSTGAGAHNLGPGVYDASIEVVNASGWRQSFARTFRIEQPKNVDFQVCLVAPPQRPVIVCGDQRVVTWSLELSGGQVPENATVESQLVWERAASAPQVRLKGPAEIDAINLEPLSNRHEFPIEISVSRDVPPGVYRPKILVRGKGGGFQITFNGKDELALPVEFETDLATIDVRLCNVNGRPLAENTCHTTLYSPVRPTRVRVTCKVAGDLSVEDVSFKPATASADDIQAKLHTAPAGAGDDRGQVVFELDVPSQTSPGRREFSFDVLPAEGLRLTPKSRQIKVQLNIPTATIEFRRKGNSGVVIRHRLSYWQVVRWMLGNELPAWSGIVNVPVGTAGLSNDVTCQVGGRALDLSAGTGQAEVEVSNLPLSRLGRHAIKTKVNGNYQYTQVIDAVGGRHQPPPSGADVTVALLEVEPPLIYPIVLLGLALVCIAVGYRRWRQKVPGRLLIREFGGLEPRSIVLGRRAPRVTLGKRRFSLRCLWGVVSIRSRDGSDASPAYLHKASEASGALIPMDKDGGWEEISTGDRLVVGEMEAEYVAGRPAEAEILASMK